MTKILSKSILMAILLISIHLCQLHSTIKFSDILASADNDIPRVMRMEMANS